MHHGIKGNCLTTFDIGHSSLSHLNSENEAGVWGERLCTKKGPVKNHMVSGPRVHHPGSIRALSHKGAHKRNAKSRTISKLRVEQGHNNLSRDNTHRKKKPGRNKANIKVTAENPAKQEDEEGHV